MNDNPPDNVSDDEENLLGELQRDLETEENVGKLYMLTSKSVIVMAQLMNKQHPSLVDIILNNPVLLEDIDEALATSAEDISKGTDIHAGSLLNLATLAIMSLVGFGEPDENGYGSE